MKQQLVQDTSDSDATAAGGRGAGGRGKAKKSSKAKRIAKAAAALSTVSETSQMDYHHHHHHQEEHHHSQTHQQMSGYSNTAYQEHSEEVSAGHNASSLAAHQQDLITPVILERATAHMNIQGTSAAGGVPTEPKNNFDVLIRILDNRGPDGTVMSGPEDDDVSSVLTDQERFRLREVILQDEKIQTFLKETYTTERILQLKDHQSMEQVIEPQKWDVLIRILDNHEVMSGAGTGDTKSSPQRSSVTGHEVRSMTEAMVDFSYGESSGAMVSHSSGGAMLAMPRLANMAPPLLWLTMAPD